MKESRMLTVALSQSEMLKTIYAESAWNDIANIASVPPIKNAAEEDKPMLVRLLRTAYQGLCARLGGYMVSFPRCLDEEDVWTSVMRLPAGVDAATDSLISEQMTEAVVSNAMEHLYAVQPQAGELCDYYRERHEHFRSSLLMMLARG